MKYSKYVKALFMGMILIVGIHLLGCEKPPVKDADISESDDLITGGKTINTNYDAPKEIASDKIVSFSTKFFLDDENIPERSAAIGLK